MTPPTIRWNGRHRTFTASLFLMILMAIGSRSAIPVLAQSYDPGKQTNPTEPATAPPDKPDEAEEEQIVDEDAKNENATHTEEEFVIVEGQVINHIGGGDQGIKVTVRRKEDGNEPGEIIAETETDELGDFRVTSAEEVDGDVTVTFTKLMYKTLERELHIGDREWPEYLAEQLEGDLIFVGRVMDSLTDQPIANASVALQASYNEWKADSGEDGRYVIKGIPPGSGELIVTGEGYGREKQRVARLEDFGEVTISLKPQRVIYLHVVDDQDAPISGVTVELYDQGRDDFRTAVTDEEGKVKFTGIHFDADILGVRLTHGSHVSDSDFDRQAIMPAKQTESTHKFTMERAGAIAGVVRSKQNRQTLNGARIMTGTTTADGSPRDWTSYSGEYDIQGVAPGSVTITAHLAGYAPHLVTVEVAVGKTTKLDFSLRQSSLINGVVKSKSGSPVHGAIVEAIQWRDHATLGLRAMTDAQGRFAIENAPWDEFEVNVSGPAGGRTKSKVDPTSTELLEITLPDPPVRGGAAGQILITKGDAAPDFSTKTITGKPIKLSDFKGKTVLLDFWATWCGPCVVDVPRLLEVYKKLSPRKDFVMIGVSLDFDEKALRKFVNTKGIVWDQIVGDDAQRIADEYGVRAFPNVFLINPNGRVLVRGLPSGAILSTVEELLKARDPS